MTDAHSELMVAARHLAQWGRTRQAVWQDASSDLLAALGNRYASFDDLQSEPLPPPPPAPPRNPQPVTPPMVFAPVTPPPPVPTPEPAPAVAVVPIAASVKAPVRTPAAAPRPVSLRRPNLGRIVLAAAVVLAAVASPSLWRVYETSRVVAPTTNMLTIETTPPGSLVLIDGVESGKTPLATSMTLGVHHVELRYRKNVRKIDVDVIAGQPMVTRVDWTRRPAVKPRQPAKNASASRVPTAAKAPTAATTRAADGAPAQSETPAVPASTVSTGADSAPDADAADAADSPAVTEPVPQPAPDNR